MTIASEITRLQNDKAAICAAIEDKGVTVGNASLDDYAACVAAISTGPKYGYIDVLAVGGGAAGYSKCYDSSGGGGGGAGWIDYASQLPIQCENYSVVVGHGGSPVCCNNKACPGTLSSFGGSLLCAKGGCVCNSCCGCCSAYGGDSRCKGGVTNRGNNNNMPGGGGGYASAGGDGCWASGANTGCAGCGCFYDIDGSNKLYGAGGSAGGGCSYYCGCYCGGGTPQTGQAKGGNITLPGTNATCCGGGGGGAGGSKTSSWVVGGKGGDGVVIVRYHTDGSDGLCNTSYGGCKYTCGAYTIHCFTYTGSTQQFVPVYK